MTTSDKIEDGINIGYYDDSKSLAKDLTKHIKAENLTFLCIGTDRSTGDSFAPFIGTMLQESGYKNVIGTIDNPAHGQNLDRRIKEIEENAVVVAIDASLGRSSSVGRILLNKGKLHPGSALGKDLTAVGDYNIKGVVNISGYSEFEVLSCTRLSTILKMAKTVVHAIENSYPLHDRKNMKDINKNKLKEMFKWIS